jgi:hypothetical protein
MHPRVQTVVAQADYLLRLTLMNGEVRVFDVKPYLDYGISRELRDMRMFSSIRPVLGSIQWTGGQDFCRERSPALSFCGSGRFFH